MSLSHAALSVSDQIVASCVGLLLTPDVYADPDWHALVVAEMHDHLPQCDATHTFMGPLVREIPRAWPKGGVVQSREMAFIPARRAWVQLQKWRLGEALARVRAVAA